jgi:hypothetical protein
MVYTCINDATVIGVASEPGGERSPLGGKRALMNGQTWVAHPDGSGQVHRAVCDVYERVGRSSAYSNSAVLAITKAAEFLRCETLRYLARKVHSWSLSVSLRMGKMTTRRPLEMALAVLAASACLPLAGGAQRDRAMRRDVKRYDQAGPYVLDLKVGADARSKIEAQVREFLWGHWRRRRLGHLVFTAYSKEGEPSTSSYFVEPDQEGIWRIAVTIERRSVARGGMKGEWQKRYEYCAYSLERIEPPVDGLTPRALIPHDESRPPDGYRLVFKDSGGKTINEF